MKHETEKGSFESAMVATETFVHIEIDDTRLHTGKGVILWNGQRWIGLGLGLDVRLNATVASSLPNVEVPNWAIKLTLPDDVAGGMKTWKRKRYRGKEINAYVCGCDIHGRPIGELQRLNAYIERVGAEGQNMTVVEASHFPPRNDQLDVYLRLLDEQMRSANGMSRIDIAIVEKRNDHSEKVVIGWNHEDNTVAELSEPSDDIKLVERAFYSLTGHMRDQSTIAPRFLFKYENRRFCDSFVNGRVKVTSAKDMERYEDPQRKDVESHKTTSLDRVEIEEFPKVPGVREQTVTRTKDGCQLDFDIEPYFAFCTSTVLKTSLLDEFSGSDTIIQIVDPGDFVRRLLLAGRNALDAKGDLCWHGCVSYERHQDFAYYGRVRSSIAHPAFIKPKRYEAQQEHRIAWVTSEAMVQTAPNPTIMEMGTNECAVRLYSKHDALALLRSIGGSLDRICGDVRAVSAISSFVCKS